MAVSIALLTETQRKELLANIEAGLLVKAKTTRSPTERADAARRAMSGRRLPLRVTKGEYRP
jgi:hypothetical protein